MIQDTRSLVRVGLEHIPGSRYVEIESQVWVFTQWAKLWWGWGGGGGGVERIHKAKIQVALLSQFP